MCPYYIFTFNLLTFMIVHLQDNRRHKKTNYDNSGMNINSFKELLQKLSDSINHGNTSDAVSCFTEDAVYYVPVDKQLIKGKDELKAYFTGISRSEAHAALTWHNIIFDEWQQAGALEFTFSLKNSFHGIIIVKIKDNRIYRIREYKYKSTYDWEQFAGKSIFYNYPFTFDNEFTFSDNLDARNNFKKLMLNIAESWNTGNPQRAAECFAQDAIYMEPPDKQYYKSRSELQAFFQETTGIAPMKMAWHYLLFNDSTQTGAGEYSFTWNNLTIHGIVILKIDDNHVKLWREYQHHSDLDWKGFIGESDFNNRIL